MDFRVLGPLEAHDEDRRLPLGGRKQRVLLAVLLLARNEPVSRDRLIDALWGEQPPETAPHTLDAYVSRLRKVLGPDRLVRGSGAYRLQVRAGELDLDRFEQLSADGRELLARGDATGAAEKLREALELWTGAALADLAYEPFGAATAAALDDRRLAAVEDRIDADLSCGRARELVGELTELVCNNPFRERLLGQGMLALYRSGQHARALEAFRNGRRKLAEELGLEPGPALKELERAILAHDARLDLRPQRSVATSLTSGRRVAGGAVAALLVAFAAGAFVLLHGGHRAGGVVQLAEPAAAIAHGFGSVWVADPARGAVERLDEVGKTVVDRIPVGGAPGALVVGGGSVWAATVPGERVTRIDPGSGTITQSIGLAGGRVVALAFGSGSLWVADATDRSLLEIDPSSGRLRRSVALSLNPTALAVVGDRVWVADYSAGTVTEVDPRSGGILATVRTGTGPAALAVSGGGIWVVNTLDSTVSRIDAQTGTLTRTVAVTSSPVAVVASGRSIWVASRYPGSVTRFDSVNGAVVASRELAGSPTAAAASGDRVWVGMQSLVPHHGGTVRVLHTPPITLDPAFQ